MERIEVLLDLLDRWDELSDSQPVSPETFCTDHPELLQDFCRILQQRGRLVRILNGHASPALSPEAMVAKLQSGRFPVVKFHDKGGLGWVYLAWDRELGRTVALKCLQPDPATDPAACRRFIREAEITARLEHPGIVPIYGMDTAGSGEAGDVSKPEPPTYAMRFVQGETLRVAIGRLHTNSRVPDWRSIEGTRILRSFVTVCETIAFAHSRHVVHRDLKSANIMLGAYGETLVLDWGLARLQQETTDSIVPPLQRTNRVVEDNVTQAGETLGTVGFMSPEQAAGDWARVGTASDIFSLGAILYQMLTDQSPYSGNNSLADAKACRFLSPHLVKSRIPKPLVAICRKAMQCVPSDRYASALELKTDIERFLADEPISAAGESISERTRRLLRKHRLIAQMGALMILTAIIMLSWFLTVMTEKNRELEIANEREADAKDEAIRQRNQVREKLIESVRENYAASMAQVAQAISDRQPERLKDLLNRARPRIGSPVDPRGIEWWMSWEKAFGAARPVPVDGRHLTGVRLIGNGEKILARTDDQRLVVIDTQSGFEQLSVPTRQTSLEIWNDRPRDLPCSSDGSTLVIHEDSEIKIYTVKEAGYETTSTLKAESRVFVTALSQDGRILVSGDGQGVVTVWNLTTHDSRRFPVGEGEAIVRLQLSPDGRFLAYFRTAADGSRPMVLNLETGISASVPMEVQSEFSEMAFGQYDTLLAWNSDRVVTCAIEFQDETLRRLWETDLTEFFEFDVLHDRSRSIREWIDLTPEHTGTDPQMIQSRIHSGDTAGLVRATRLAVMLPKNAIKSETDDRQIGFRMFYREPAKELSGDAVFDLDSKRPVAVTEFRLPSLESVIDLSPDGETALIRSVDGQYSILPRRAWSWECIDHFDISGPVEHLAWDDSDVLTTVREPSHVYTNDSAEFDRCKTPFDQSSGLVHQDLKWSPSCMFSSDLSVLADYRENQVHVRFGANWSETRLYKFGSEEKSFPDEEIMFRVFPWPRLAQPWVLCVPKDEPDEQAEQQNDKTRLSIVDYELSRVVHMLEIPGAAVIAAALSDNGREVAVVSGNLAGFNRSNQPAQLQTWSVLEDRTIAKRSAVDISVDVRCLAFNPAGTQIAAGGLDGTVVVVDLRTGETVMTTSGHESLVRALTFSPDGSRLITAGDDRIVRFFSTSDWQQVMMWRCAATPVGLAFSRNGQQLAIGDDSGHIEVIAAATGRDLLQTASLWLKQPGTSSAGEEAIIREMWADFVTREGRSEDELEAGLRAIEPLRSRVKELSVKELRQQFAAALPPSVEFFPGTE